MVQDANISTSPVIITALISLNYASLYRLLSPVLKRIHCICIGKQIHSDCIFGQSDKLLKKKPKNGSNNF